LNNYLTFYHITNTRVDN